MAWESRRNGRQYYYRSRRIGGRVVKQYFGAGIAAYKAAAEDEAARERRIAEADARAAERMRMAEPELLLDALEVATKALMRSTLTAAGYHQHHRGEWRKRRG
jgi:hypothetical protein